jgi:hypothetical protein
MAFNFRPTNSDDIRKKKNNNLTESVIAIFNFCKKNYNVTIVLDPTTSFNKIKIPREVEKEHTIQKIKQDMRMSKINLNGINVEFGNGSGKGGSSIDAKTTAMQENCTRLFCEVYNETGKFPDDESIKKIYPNYDDFWYETFKMQAIAIKKFLNNKGYEFSRDDGIMPYLENIAKTKCGVKTKDNWNPADIYAVKKNEKILIEKELKKIKDSEVDSSVRLKNLNNYMRVLLNDKHLVGISLKKLGKTVTTELTNLKGISTLKDIEIVDNSIKCDLDIIQSKGEFVTGELSFQIKVNTDIVNVQVRAFSGGRRESTQMDMTGKGAQAKLGKVSSSEAIDPFISEYNLTRRMGTEIPRINSWNQRDIDYYVNEFDKLLSYKISGNSVYFGKRSTSKESFRNVLNEAIEFEKENNRMASQLCAKLQCFRWIEILHTIDKKGNLKEFLTILYHGAKKEYKSAGPFLKVY